MPDEPKLPASEAELIVAALTANAAGKALLDKLDENEGVTEDLLDRVVELRQELRRLAAGALELEVASVTVPDFPPAE